MRTLSSNNQANSALRGTAPLYLAALGFSTTLRLSSRGDVRWNGNDYSRALLTVNLGGEEGSSMRFFDTGFAYSAIFKAQGTDGISVTVYQLFGPGPFASGDADIYFSGVLGPAEIGEFIEVQLLDSEPSYTPKIRATSDIFTHLPAAGTELVTRAGTFVLERDRT